MWDAQALIITRPVSSKLKAYDPTTGGRVPNFVRTPTFELATFLWQSSDSFFVPTYSSVCNPATSQSVPYIFISKSYIFAVNQTIYSIFN